MINKKKPRENRFGITDFDFWFHHRPINEIKALFEAGASFMKDLGIHWDRVHLPGIFSWNVIEKSRGHYDWTITDALVDISQDYGIHLTPNIWPYAAWDQDAYSKISDKKLIDLGLGSGAAVPVDSSFPIPKRYGIPNNLESYKNWLAALVERYNGNGIKDMPGLRYPIKYWEIAGGYRAIVPFFFQGTVEEFVRLLEISYVTIKENDPESSIINAGPASLARILEEPELDLNKDQEIVFFDETLKLGSGDYFDILSIMTNGLNKNSSLKLINHYQNLLEKYGCVKPLWISEIASHCNKGDFMRYALPNRSPEEQAANQVKQFTIAFSAGIKMAFYTALGPAKPKGFELSSPLESIGYIDMVSLLDGKGEKRPAYHTFKLMISLLDNFKKVESLKSTGETDIYLFKSDKNSIYVLWSNNNEVITLTGLETKTAKLINSVPKTENGKVILDAKGQAIFLKRTLRVKEGKISLHLNNIPIFLRIENIRNN